jgi:hypothetical protein
LAIVEDEKADGDDGGLGDDGLPALPEDLATGGTTTGPGPEAADTTDESPTDEAPANEAGTDTGDV